MNKIIIALAIVLAILVGLLAFFLIREKNDAKQPTESTTVQTEAITEATETTEATEAPTQTDAPTETEATEAPTEPPAPVTEATEETEKPTETAAPIEGEQTNSGQFTSNTGTGLELVVDWKTYTSSDGTKMVRFDVSISSFTINVGPRIDGIHITMDGVTKSFDSVDVTWSGSKTTNLLASCTMEMSGDSAAVDVAWDFRGTYAGETLEQVTASGTVTR
ncbi:MAG: hypothetical protein IJG45_09180 [Oscillospiraceae bacterium]|nr:hypothetical protein [Oscillospiraceae bacterium]